MLQRAACGRRDRLPDLIMSWSCLLGKSALHSPTYRPPNAFREPVSGVLTGN